MSAPELLPGERGLLDAFRRGDPTALTRVYRAYSADVARYLSRGFCTNAGTARVLPVDLDSAHQETFVRAFSERARLAYDGLRPYRPLLLSIARSAAVDLLRASGKLSREAIPLDDAPELRSLPEEADGPEDCALKEELAGLVREFLATLSEQERALAEARFVEGNSQEKAAALVGLSRQEVRTREARLRKAFTDFLSQRGWLEGPSGGTRPVAAAIVLAALAAGTALGPWLVPTVLS